MNTSPLIKQFVQELTKTAHHHNPPSPHIRAWLLYWVDWKMEPNVQHTADIEISVTGLSVSVFSLDISVDLLME